MARVSVSLFGVFVTVVALSVPAQGAAAPPVAPQDFVVGGGEAGPFHEISINASSDPLGGDPSGVVSFAVEIVVDGNVARVSFGGPVTCLAVEGNRAVIGFVSFIPPLAEFRVVKAVVVDNGSTGSPADEFGVAILSTDCSDETGVFPFPLDSGDIVVHDATTPTTNDDCKKGGWRNFTDDQGVPFRNQGQCGSFVVHASKGA